MTWFYVCVGGQPTWQLTCDCCVVLFRLFSFLLCTFLIMHSSPLTMRATCIKTSSSLRAMLYRFHSAPFHLGFYSLSKRGSFINAP